MSGLLEGKKLLGVNDVKPGDRIVVCDAVQGTPLLHIHIASKAYRDESDDRRWAVDVKSPDGTVDSRSACSVGLVQDCAPSKASNYVAIMDDKEGS